MTMMSEEEAYHTLCAYTLSLRDPEFIHQHVVDAYAAQQANNLTKPIGLTFAVIGLYLLVEKGFSGREVQRVHMKLAERKHEWPILVLPEKRGIITAIDVIQSPEGMKRKKAIHEWCASVWSAYAINRNSISDLLQRHHII